MKKRKFVKKLLSSALAVSMAASLFPVSALAVTGSEIAADGTYSASVSIAEAYEEAVVWQSEDEDDWEDYTITVELTVEDGVFSAISVTSADLSVDSESYFNKATTKSQGFVTLLTDAEATADTIESWDAVSAATCTSEAIRVAALNALASADAAEIEEEDTEDGDTSDGTDAEESDSSDITSGADEKGVDDTDDTDEDAGDATDDTEDEDAGDATGDTDDTDEDAADDAEDEDTSDSSQESKETTVIEEGTYTIAAESDGSAYYSFTPEESFYYTFSAESDASVTMYLYNSSGSQLDYYSASASDTAHIQYRMTSGVTYYILLDYDATETGSLSFTAKQTECVEITGEGTYTAQIPFQYAYTVFSFTPEESGYYQLSSSGDYYREIVVYSSSWSSDVNYGGSSIDIPLYLTAGKTYYIVGYTYYSLSYLSEITLTVEAIDPTVLTETGSYTAEIALADDIAWYSFTPEEGGVYNIYTTGSSDTYAILYNSSLKLLVSDDNDGTGDNAYVSYVMSAGTTYFIELCYKDDSETGSISFVLEQETPVAISVDELDYSTEAEIENGGYTVYSFTPEETGYYNLYTTGDYNTYMRLYNSSWISVESDNNSGTDSNAAFSYRMTAGETYYIVLQFYYDSSSEGSFGFNLISVETEVIGVGSYTVEIPFLYAYAAFEFTPEESGYYKVSVDSGDYSSRLYLYDSSWSEISYASGVDADLLEELTAGETYYYASYVTASLSDVSEYTFTLESMVPTVLTETGDYSAEIVMAGGCAYYSFTPDTDGIYIISAEDTADASVVLCNSDWDELVSAEGSGASVFYWLTSDTTYYFKVAYADEENTGTIGFSLEMAEATAIEEGTYTVEVESDGFAFYSFTPEEDFYYEFSAESDADVTIYLYDSSMTVIDSDSASGGYLAGFQYKLTEGETYYILLLFDASEAGSFTFTAQKTECVEITEGGTYTAEIRYEDSCAFFSFTPDTSDLYVFSAEETANVSIELYGDLDMMGAIGITLLDSVQGAGASVSYRLTSGTTYYFKVAYADEESTGTIGFTFEEVETTAIEEGTYTIAAESDGYVCYSFTPDENFLYVFSAESDAAVEMSLYNSYDVQLRSTSASGGSTANINYLLTGGETYSIVLAYDAAEAGSFSFTVEKVECVEMTEDGTYTAEIPFSYAYTVFSLTPEESGYYTLSASGDYYMSVYLYDSSWSYVSYDSGTEISIQIGLSAGETYYYRCYVYASVSDQPEMTVTLEEADSTELSEPGEYTAEITTAGSSVWYTFTPEESGLYKIYTTGSSDTYVELYESEDSYGEEDDNDGTDSNAYIWDWLTAGETYYIQLSYVDEEESGSIDFVLEQPEVSTLSGTGTISIASEDLGRVVYSFSPETDGYYNFVASGAEGMRLEVYYLSGGVWHRYGDDFKPDIRSADTRSLWASSDQTYYIFVTCEDMDDTADGELTIEPSDITEIEEGESTDLEINFEGAYEIASFTPSVSGIYTVILTDTDTGDYVYLDIYDSEWSHLSGNYDGGGETSCTLELSIGETYYFVTQVYEYGDAICTIEVDCIESYDDGHTHDYEAEVTDPTCTEEGYTTYTCSECGDSYVDDYTDALGHSYEEEVTDPTCIEEGYTTYTCSVCGDTYVDDYTDALGHSWDEGTITKEAGCEESGVILYMCTMCGETYEEEIPAVGHSYEAEVTDPTCTEQGYTTYTCSECGDSYVDDYTDALGHSYEAEVTEPSCTEEGYTTYTCSVCGDTYVDDYTDALGHSYEAKVTDPTCTEEGYTTYTCSECGDTYVDDYTDALGHSYEAEVTDPTCTEEGYTTYTCSVCGDTYVDDYTDALGHSYEAVVTEPTSEEPGYTTYTCSVCGDTYVDDYIYAVTITGSDTEVTYAGSAIDITALFEIDENAGAATYTVTAGTGEGTFDEETLTLTVTKAGTFTITVETAATDAYTAGSASAVLTVEKGEGSGSVSIEDWAYGEDAVDPVPESETNGTDNVSYSYESTDDAGYSSSEAPTAIGTYKVTATFAETDLYESCTAEAEFEITKKDASLSVSVVETKTYGDEDFTLETTVDEGYDGILTYTSSDTSVLTVDESGNVTIVGVGTAVITITASETDTYAGTTAEISITVEKTNGTLTVTEAAYTVTYGDDSFTISGISSDSTGEVTYTSSDTSVVTVDETGTVTIVGAGTAVITITAAEDSLYTEAQAEVTITVAQKDVTVTIADSTKTYGDEDPELTYTAEGLEDGDELTGLFSIRTEGEDVGAYEASASQEDGANPNYNITFMSGTLLITAKSIEEATVTLGDALVANGEEQTQTIASITVTNALGETMEVTTYEVEGNTGTEAGIYTMTITGTGNFTGSITVTFEIAEAIDTSELEELIAEAEALTESDYTAESWADLAEALTAAEAALEALESQTAVDTAADALEEAIAALEEAAVIDTAGLEALIAEAEALTEDDYTATSWADMKDALADAQEALQALESQEAVNEAAEALEAAIAALEKAAADNSDDQSEDTRNGDGQMGDTRDEDEELINGLKKTEDSWYWYGNSEIVSGYTGLVYNDQTYGGAAGWYYVVNGKVDFTYTGLVKHDATYGGAAGWYYVVNGKVDFTVTDVVYNNGTYGIAGWWYVENARVDFSYTGLVKHSADNGGVSGWYYVDNAKIDFSVTGLVYNSGTYGTAGWWYVENAKIDFSVTGLVYNSGTYGGTVGWYYVKNAKVDFSFTGLFRGSDGDWYFIKAGALQGDVDGLVFNSGTYGVRGWWYMKDGKVQFSYTGAATNANGTWFVKNGMVDFGYSGTVTISGKTYTVKNGQVQ